MILLMAIRVMQAILSVGCTKRARRTGRQTRPERRRGAGSVHPSQLTLDGALMEEALATALWVLSDLLAVCNSANTPILRS